MHSQARLRLLHVIANQCAHWCGNPFSPQRSLASWHYFGQIRGTLSRIRLRHCPPSCPTAGVTDCHVASLLAMTCRNLLRVRTARTHLGRNVVHFTRARRCASLPGLWMSLRTSALKWCGNPHPPAGTWYIAPLPGCAHTYQACHCEPVRTLVWQSVTLAAAHSGKQHLGQIRSSLRIRPTSCLFLPVSAGMRIATSLRSSQ